MPGMLGLDLARGYSGPTACRHGHHVVAYVGKDRRESCLVVCGNRPKWKIHREQRITQAFYTTMGLVIQQPQGLRSFEIGGAARRAGVA